MPIPAHLSWPVEESGTSDLPRLGVGRFTDVRPPAEREGVRPPLRVGSRGLVREGENRTGDAAFADEVTEGVRRDVTATLARSGDFSEVVLVPFEAGEWPAQHALDYALVASVEEFAGVQYQRSEVSPFWIGWLRNRYRAPTGSVRVHYRLYDPLGLVWEGRIETRREIEDASITAAALDAMALNSEELSGRLRKVIPGERADARVVATRVLDGCQLGRRGVAGVVKDASDVFEREAGLRLSPIPEPWRPPEAAELEAVLSELVRGIEPPPGGIVLALMPLESAGAGWLPEVRYGIADHLGSHVLVGCTAGGEVRTVTAIHEIGHLLGAVHVRDRSSVMHAVAEFDGRFFDPLNRRILRASRTRPFGEPLPVQMRRRLEAIYRAAARFPGQVEPRDLEAALTALREVSEGATVGTTAELHQRGPASAPTAPR